MPTSRRRRATTLTDHSVGLASSAWAELGVSGWARAHDDWAVDPEPLILFTAWLGDTDPRLRDEATDWCIHNWRYVSKVRLRNLLRDESDEVRESFGEFAATVNAHAGVAWPKATEARVYQVTGRSSGPQLERPSMVWLRLRAMFGLGARTEILRYFLSSDQGTRSVAKIAESAGYMKRNVAEECETLERAGVLAVRSVRNRFYYSLARKRELRAFVGEFPSVIPQWSSVLRIASELVKLDRDADRLSQRVFAVNAHRTLNTLFDALDEIGIEGPEEREGPAFGPAVQEWAAELLSQWASGRWPEDVEVKHGRTVATSARRVGD